MKPFHFLVGILVSFSAFAQSTVDRESIKSLSLILPSGEYSGTQNGKACTVSVVDNGGDGSGYSIAVTLGRGTIPAQFTVTPGQKGSIGKSTASVQGVNYQQNLFFDRIEEKLLVIVVNRSGSDFGHGPCYLTRTK